MHRLLLVLVWLAVAASAIVFSEPAPFDLIMFALMALLPMVGLSAFNRPLILLASGFMLIACFGFIASTLSLDIQKSATHTFISLYLSLAAIVLAGFVMRDPARRVKLMMNAYLIAAVFATTAGLVGYFGIVPNLQELLTAFGRARGTFKDPNVFGAFLAPAAVYAIYLWFARPGLKSILPLAASGYIVLGLLLSFSRGAWINTGLAFAIFAYLSFVTARNNRAQIRLFLLGFFGVAGLAGVLFAALQVDAVSNLLQERASFNQSYDNGPEGRFGGQDKAKALLLEHPFGIGALQFSAHYHPEDVHNVYLNQFMNAGWVGGLGFILIAGTTLLAGLRACFRRTEFQGLMITIYAAFAGQAGEGIIIDLDHWRHYFLLFGMVWGMLLAARKTEFNSPLH